MTHLRKPVFAILSVALMCLASATAARAGVSVYADEENFFRAADIVSTETFDEFPPHTILGIGAAEVDCVAYTSEYPTGIWWTGGLAKQVPPRFISSPNDFGQKNVIGEATLSFHGSTDAIGFYLFTPGVTTSYDITVTTVGGGRLVVPLVGFNSPVYRGFVAPEGIVSVKVTHRFDPIGRTQFSFDNVSRGKITPPAGAVLQLITDETTGRAAALDSVTFTRDPFPVRTAHNFSPDGRTRLILFAANLNLEPGEDASAVTAQAEDSENKTYPLTVESVEKAPQFCWLTQVVVRLPYNLPGGDVRVSLALRGEVSNKALIRIEPAAYGSP